MNREDDPRGAGAPVIPEKPVVSGPAQTVIIVSSNTRARTL